MMHWNKKTYARELKKRYWDIEPHFYYYSLIKFIGLFRTFNEEKMSYEDVQSALYGEFVSKGKKIPKGFYANFNLTHAIVLEIINERSFHK